jgi:hypothetical protein
MKRSIRKLKQALDAGRKVVRRGKRARARALRDSVARWTELSRDIPTAEDLRNEFADWKSFDPIPLDEIGSIRFALI